MWSVLQLAAAAALVGAASNLRHGLHASARRSDTGAAPAESDDLSDLADILGELISTAGPLDATTVRPPPVLPPTQAPYDSGEGDVCSSVRTRVLALDDARLLCFSKAPLRRCIAPCRPTARAPRLQDFFCEGSTPTTRYWAQQVRRQGKVEGLDFSMKKTTDTIRVYEPQGCFPG